jgi:beta-lactamase superfamily II metal-dependent hydrolase
LLLFGFAGAVSFGAPTPEPPPAPAAVSYSDAYLLERSAAALTRSGDAAGALEKYRSAAAIYERLLAETPEANRSGLTVRLQECRSRIEEASSRHPLRVHFIDVGQGDSTLIQCPDGSTILIDGGLITCYPYLIGYLKGAGVERINLMIATHPDGDHIGGLIKALKEFPVGMVVDTGKAHTTVLYERFLKTVRDFPGTVYKLGRAGDRFVFGPVEIRLLHPGANLPKDNNNCSIVARLAYRDFSVLLTGDAEESAEKY